MVLLSQVIRGLLGEALEVSQSEWAVGRGLPRRISGRPVLAAASGDRLSFAIMNSSSYETRACRAQFSFFFHPPGYFLQIK